MDAHVTGYIVAGPDRPPVDNFVAMLEALWSNELVVPIAVLSCGLVTDQREVSGPKDPGAERAVAWTGDSVRALGEAVRAAWSGDVAVWFPRVTARAFARPRVGGAPWTPGDDVWDHAGTVAPSLCLYSVTRPIKVSRSRRVPGEGRSLGRSSAWATLDGPSMDLLREYLNDSDLKARLVAQLGKVRVGDEEW